MTVALTSVIALLLQAAPQVPAASIEGFVLRAGTNEPIARSRITVRRSGEVGEIPSVTTDSQGHFILKNLKPGSYSLTAQRNGFARQMYGERTPGRGGTPLTIVAGQELKDVIFRLIPTGALSGRVSDSTGEPLIGITVQLLKSVYTAPGKRTFQVVASGRTDDHGEYRLYSLTPGRYFINALPEPSVLERSPFENEVIEPGYAHTYYPGTIDSSGAVGIDLQPGAEIRTIDFTLSQQRLFRVRGRVFDPQTGKPPPAEHSVQLMPRNAETNLEYSSTGEAYNPVNGTFELRDVPPGSYWVSATQFDVRGIGALGPSNLRLRIARQPIDISNADVENVVLTFSPGFPVQGRISMDNGAPVSQMFDSRESTVTLISKGEGIPPFPAEIRPDGIFVVDNTQPGEYHVEVNPLPENYYVKSVRLGQVDVRNELSITGPVSGAIEVVLSGGAAQLEGTVVDKDRKPVANAQAVLIPGDRRERAAAYKTAVSDQNGRFTMNTIVPGTYKLFAWEDIEPLAYMDPDFLRQYEESSISVSLSESARINVETKVIPATQ